MKSLSIPAAIVAGFGMLSAASGLGLYFGLRRPVPPIDSIQSVPTLTGATSRASASAAGVTATAPVAVVPSSVTSDAAKAAIAAQHDHLVEKCWKPSFARNPLPAQVSFALIVGYAEDGHLASHTLKPAIPGARPDVTACVYNAITIPPASPPGRAVSVSVPIAFP